MHQTMTNIINRGNLSWQEWNAFGCAQRAELILRWADFIERQDQRGEMAAKMIRYQVQHGSTIIGHKAVMPGPTGESNELYFSGRGVFIIHCEIDAPLTALVAMISAALLAGNCIVLSLSEKMKELPANFFSSFAKAGFPEYVIQDSEFNLIETLILEPSSAGVAFVGSSEQSIALARLLASRSGLLAQLISETDMHSLNTVTDRYFALRFITEKTCTINITAVGGNAKLLALGCGDK